MNHRFLKHLLGLVLALGFVAPTLAEPPTSTAGLRESGPVSCTMEDVTLRGRYIVTDGNAVETLGVCDITIIDSYIEAGGVAVLVASAGDVEIRNSHIQGGQAGLLITSAGDIEYSDSRIRGGASSTSTGELEDEGGNDVDGAVSSVAGALSLRAGNVAIDMGDISVPGVEIHDGEISVASGSVEIGAGGVRMSSGSASVVVDGDSVRLDSGTAVVIAGDWRESDRSHFSSADTGKLMIELNATQDGDQVQLELAGDVLFDFGSADLRTDTTAQLGKVAHLLRERSAGEILVTGHTDSKGSAAYNRELSMNRAVAVMNWLNRNEGIPADVMRGQGLGASKPLAYNTMPDGADNPSGRAMNRRVEISFATRK